MMVILSISITVNNWIKFPMCMKISAFLGGGWGWGVVCLFYCLFL